MAGLFENYFSSFSFNTLLEIVAVITALIYVLLASKEKAICFLFALISSAIYIYICFIHKLYFDTLISVYYAAMAIVGWFYWKKSEKSTGTGISYVGRKKMLFWVLVGLAAAAILGSIAHTYTDAYLPYLDSFTTVFAVIATVMVIKKQIENWILLAIIDAASVGMYLSKDLLFTSLLYVVYTIIAINGYRLWKRKYLSQNKN